MGAPELGDPRIRLKARRVNGRTVVPLAQGPAGVRAWKMILPVTQATPRLRRHEGHEGLYVLAGRVRLVLGEQDLVLEVGGAIEFDTSVAHWFGSAGERPAEVLSLFGRPGERIRLRPASPT